MNQALIMSLAYMFGGLDGLTKKSKSELDNIDIEKEYKLILEKKSNLSANNRQIIIFEYETKQKNKKDMK